MLPLQARVDLGAMEIKGYSAFPKAQALPECHHQICLMSYPGHLLGESYFSAEVQSVYFTAPANWATRHSLFMGWVLPLCRKSSQCILQPQLLGHRTLIGRGTYLSAKPQCILQPLFPADLASHPVTVLCLTKSFAQQILIVASAAFELVERQFSNRQRYTFICGAFKSHTYILWSDCICEDLERVVYPFIAITLKFIPILSGSTC